MDTTITLSIIVPAYNESARIAEGLEQILTYLGQQDQPAELIVVDDGSTDGTGEIVEQIMGSHVAGSIRMKLLSHPTNQGKGSSVRTGILNASGMIVVFTDADLSAPISELPKLVDPIRQGQSSISIGSRAINRGLIGRRQSRLREWAGRIFNLCMRVIVGLEFKDTQCGFKAFQRKPMVPVFQWQKLEGFGFDVEILYLAKKQGLRIAEIPVIWNHAEGSRVHMVKDSLQMFLDLMKIRWYDVSGRYTDAPAAAPEPAQNPVFRLP